jgi:hypothetical protein
MSTGFPPTFPQQSGQFAGLFDGSVLSFSTGSAQRGGQQKSAAFPKGVHKNIFSWAR